MAINKTARETKAKESAAKGGSAEKVTTKKTAPKKAAGPKLSEPQKEMLRKVAGADPTGHRSEKKPENKTLETLLKHKLARRGKKRAESGYYRYQIKNDLKEFVREKVRSGEFASEQAVVEAALESLRDREGPDLEKLIDHEFVEYCAREGDDRITLEEVLKATSKIPGSMAQVIIEEERAERF
jgi:Arc/MetJ-type ribon-helix-helix transcriptional regulator